MSYLVFARKYRPQTFDQVVAQEHVTRTLKNAVKADRIATGYLFCGPRGTGKTTVARLLAKAINCETGPTDTPCGTCSACTEITSGNSLDVLEIDAASNTGVDDIRTLRENVRYMPTHGQKRIYIIDEVHRLSASAFDALLKTLEEPPSHVVFIFATTEPLRVPDTIHSRTQRFDFRRVSVDDLSGHLRYISDQEGLNITDGALALLARKADGSVRDSLSLLDQIAAFANQEIDEAVVASALGLVDRKFLFDFVQAVAASDRKSALLMIRDLFDSGVEVGDFVHELLHHLRCLMIVAGEISAPELIGGNADELAQYQEQAVNFKVADILRMVRVVTDLRTDLRSGLDQRLLLETAAVKLAQMESTVLFEEILDHLKSAPQEAATGNESAGGSDFFAPKPRSAPSRSLPSSEPAKPEASSQPASDSYQRVNIAKLNADWDGFVGRVRRNSPMLASQLGMAELRELRGNEVRMCFAEAEEASLQLVTKTENLKMLQEALRDHFRSNLLLKFEIDKRKAPAKKSYDEGRKPRVDPKQLLEKSERLRSIVERFDGEIIGIKKIED